MQSQIAEKVAGALAVALPGAQRQQMDAKPTENLVAYDAYMQGERLRSRESSNLTSLVRAEKVAAGGDDGRSALRARVRQARAAAHAHVRVLHGPLDETPVGRARRGGLCDRVGCCSS